MSALHSSFCAIPTRCFLVCQTGIVDVSKIRKLSYHPETVPTTSCLALPTFGKMHTVRSEVVGSSRHFANVYSQRSQARGAALRGAFPMNCRVPADGSPASEGTGSDMVCHAAVLPMVVIDLEV